MHTQRVRAGESRVKRRLLNGPWRAQSKVREKISSNLVHCDVKAYVSCRGYDGILQSAHFVNQGGTADVKE